MKTLPEVAPFESCIRCMRGDTTTAFFLRGGAEWHTAGLHVLAGIPEDQAEAMVLTSAERQFGCESGMVPPGSFDQGFRLCRECASELGTNVGEVASGSLPIYKQEDHEED